MSTSRITSGPLNLPLLFAVIVLVSWTVACTTTAGFEDARAVSEGQTKTTVGAGLSLHTAPWTVHAIRPDADDEDPDKWEGLPVTMVEPEILVRRAQGRSKGREIKATLHNPVIPSPWSIGLGAGLGAKDHLTAERDGPVEIAVGVRTSAHAARIGGGPGNTFTVGHLQLEGRLVGSFHGEKRAVSVAPKITTVFAGVRRNHVEHGTMSATDSMFLGGATLGVTVDQVSPRQLLGEQRPRRRRHFFEVGLLIGPSFSHPYLEHSAPLVETSRHMQMNVGYGVRR